MAEEIHELDYWRKFFRCATPDIFHVIYQAIRVAAADSPAEFRHRRDRIAEMLFSPHPPERDEPTRKGVPEKRINLDFIGREKQSSAGSSGVTPEAGEAVIDQIKEETWSQIVNEISKTTESLVQGKALMRIDYADNMTIQAKIEASKRKLRDGYEKADNVKKMRTIRVMPLQDAPKPGPDPKRPRRWH
ncbi:unnamed protein product [Spirodela intermedia]|uniref:Uncharacterized protein n=1 Tax=Spirodela intermedia TaxID=51605 RepID=A0A7I8JI00_SPIIN|nr:unnamed protein product [Spirodela intermedia]CAA6669173.1 unnamed protein product [Spirodela intermedia]